MPKRRLQHPQVTICDDQEGFSLEFVAPGSTFGPVEIVLSHDEANKLVEDIEMAIVFASSDADSVPEEAPR